MASSTKKHVVFDIVGTVVGYQVLFDAMEERLGDKLRKIGIKPELLAWTWMEAAEREGTYLDRSGRYTPFKNVFKPLFFRILAMAGIEKPREFATDEDAEYIAGSYKKLSARPGIHEAIQKLRDAGFTVWALTSGDAQRVQGYLANNNVEVPDENFVTCDQIGISKPAPEVYKYVLEKLGDSDQKWFAAAHMWDSAAAKHNGFKAAWCSVWEIDPAVDVFGELDVMADNFSDMADGIIKAAS